MVLVAVIYLALCALQAASATAVTYCVDDIFADPDTCDHFYKCDNGKPVLFTCPDNLFFNTAAKVCDWPYNVKCDAKTGKRPGDSSSAGQGSKADQSYTNQGSQHNSNNHGNQQNGYNQGYQQNGNQYQADQPQSATTNQDNYDDEEDGRNWYTNLQNTDAQDSNVAPSNVAAPAGWGTEENPRITVDDLYNARNNPYEEFEEREREQKQTEENPRLTVDDLYNARNNPYE